MAHELKDPVLNEKQLAAWLGISLANLQRLRSNGSGPPFIQLSERRIGYRLSTAEQWLAARTITRIGALMSVKQTAHSGKTAEGVAP